MLSVQTVSTRDVNGRFFRDGDLSDRLAAAAEHVSDGWARVIASDGESWREFFVTNGAVYELERSTSAATGTPLAGDEPELVKVAAKFPSDAVLAAAYRGLLDGRDVSWSRVI